MKPYPKMTAQNTALAVIDMVNGCCHENCEDKKIKITFSKIRAMAPKLQDFIEKFRRQIGGKIIFTNITPWTKEYLPENLQQLYEDPATTYYSDGADFKNEFYLVQPQKEDFVLTKNTYDAFTNPELEKFLKANSIQYLVITGVFTDGCVLATIISGFSRGYNFVMLKDLLETTDVPTRQELSNYLTTYTFPIMYGKTINSEEFINKF